ncbi:CoA transferase [Amycolatopsis albispora]|uniref:Uncharacterized protein n=1 Tax=Amycolatopsis albispora TaxID=1804986 RepID=A0A344L0A1_9PSEU|nr:CoA transferase [Amycolatopsis albispora]AXB41475.1 hypothetical protein A4R43_02155 [Amycolatopsis albispora]
MLRRVIGRPELAIDERFAEREARKVHQAELAPELEIALTRRSAACWEHGLSSAGVLAAAVLSVVEMLESAQL